MEYDHDDLITLQYDRQKFGKAVRAYRGPQKPGQFANRAKISPAVLSRVERGKPVYDEVIHALCRMMGVSLSSFPAGHTGKLKDERDSEA